MSAASKDFFDIICPHLGRDREAPKVPYYSALLDDHILMTRLYNYACRSARNQTVDIEPVRDLRDEFPSPYTKTANITIVMMTDYERS